MTDGSGTVMEPSAQIEEQERSRDSISCFGSDQSLSAVLHVPSSRWAGVRVLVRLGSLGFRAPHNHVMVAPYKSRDNFGPWASGIRLKTAFHYLLHVFSPFSGAAMSLAAW